MKTVLLFNPVSGHGHWDSWHALFTVILLRAGYRVLASTSAVAELRQRLTRQGLADHPDLLILAPGDNSSAPATFHAVQRQPQIVQKFVPLIAWASSLVKKTLPVSIVDQLRFLPPSQFARRLEDILSKASVTPDLVFNMCLDIYRTSPDAWSGFDERIPLPWAGIRIDPPPPPPREAYYALNNFSGVCYLDEVARDAYAASLPRKQFGFLPDVANGELPAYPSPLATEMRQRAGHRKIVFLGGSIGGQKNLSCWHDVIRTADPSTWFFVQVGEIAAATWSPQDASAFVSLMKNPPQNFLLRTDFVPDERDFNSLFQASDFIFAVYRDFSRSSNMPAKAAMFQKPILVSERFLMGHRVRRYGIGRTVPETDASAILAALEDLRRSPVLPVQFAAYQADFCEDSLSRALTDFISRCLP